MNPRGNAYCRSSAPDFVLALSRLERLEIVQIETVHSWLSLTRGCFMFRGEWYQIAFSSSFWDFRFHIRIAGVRWNRYKRWR